MPRLGDAITHRQPVLRMMQVIGADTALSHRSGHLSPQERVSDCLERLKEHDSIANAPNTRLTRPQFSVLKTGQLEEG